MHEFSIADALFQQTIQVAEKHPRATVIRIEVEAGVLMQIVPEALETAWKATCADTPLKDAELTFTETPAAARCRPCGTPYAPTVENFLCPQCHQADAEVLAGRDILLRAVILEENP